MPIYFYLIQNKDELETLLESKGMKDIDCNERFNELYQEFIKDSLEDFIIEDVKDELLYL